MKKSNPVNNAQTEKPVADSTPSEPKPAQSVADQLAAQDFPSAPFIRRLASWVYDLLTGTAIAMLAAVLAMIVTSVLTAFNFIDISNYQDPSDYLNHTWYYPAYLLLCLTCFFSYFWVRGGQTIGMRAWRLRVVNHQGQGISIKQAVIRFYASLAGLGNLWVLFDWKNKQSLQDYAAKTRTVVLTKEANKQLYREIN